MRMAYDEVLAATTLVDDAVLCTMKWVEGPSSLKLDYSVHVFRTDVPMSGDTCLCGHVFWSVAVSRVAERVQRDVGIVELVQAQLDAEAAVTEEFKSRTVTAEDIEVAQKSLDDSTQVIQLAAAAKGG
jgi:hypothetical protein